MMNCLGAAPRRFSCMATSQTDRDLARGRRAALCVLVRGGPALAAACAQIEATFSPAIEHSMRKDRVAALMRRGAVCPEIWLRYRTLVERHPITNLDTAITLVGRLRCAEIEARAAAVRNWGHCSWSRLTLVMLDEVCLILRVLRRYAPTCFSELMLEIAAADRTKSARTNTKMPWLHRLAKYSSCSFAAGYRSRDRD